MLECPTAPEVTQQEKVGFLTGPACKEPRQGENNLPLELSAPFPWPPAVYQSCVTPEHKESICCNTRTSQSRACSLP